MRRAIPTGKLSKLMGCIIESPIKMPEGAEFKGWLGMVNILDNVPKWSPKGRIVYDNNHYGGITFKHHTGELQFLRKQDTLLHSYVFHQFSRVVGLKRLAESSNCSTFAVSNDDSYAKSITHLDMMQWQRDTTPQAFLLQSLPSPFKKRHHHMLFCLIMFMNFLM